MTTASMPRFGFRVLGNATKGGGWWTPPPPSPLTPSATEKAEVDRESYLSAFTFGEDFRRHLEGNRLDKGL